MDWYLGNNWYLGLLLLIPVFGLMLIGYIRWKKQRKDTFADSKFQKELFEKQTTFSKMLPVFYLLALFFLVLSIVDLLHGSEEVKTKQKVNNVIFLLDVSKSMNAEDVQPNRLTLAKYQLINTLSKLGSDRVGIIVFAGEATSIMPLTTDFSSAQNYIEAIQTSIMKVQGTDFLKAIQESAYKLSNIPKGSRKVVLISDGEDNEGNDAAAAKLAKEEGITIISVGVGTEQGAPVPEYSYGQLMGYKIDGEGETVISSRQTGALEKLASTTGGTYIDGNDLNKVPDEIVAAINKKSSYSETMVRSQNAEHYYQYFLVISLFFFLIILLFNPKRDFSL